MFTKNINLLVPSTYKSARMAIISILKLKGIFKKKKKKSYERRDYEPVDEKSLP